jgi:hypothetical protein
LELWVLTRFWCTLWVGVGMHGMSDVLVSVVNVAYGTEAEADPETERAPKKSFRS